MVSSTAQSAASAQTALLFFVWWFANNLFAVDTHAFFHTFASPFHVAELVLAQLLVGLAMLAIHRALVSSASPSTEPSFIALPRNPTRARLALLAAVGTVQALGALLTAASYAAIGASSTLAWKLTEPLPAMFFKRVLLGIPLHINALLSVLVVVSGVLTFTAGLARPSGYAPIISSNLIFPLRNVFIKLAGESATDHAANSPFQQFWDMQLFGLPIALLVMALRIPLAPIVPRTIFYLVRNAVLFNTYQFASVYLLAIFDTLAHSLLNTFKRFSAVIFATVIIQGSFQSHQLFGISLAFTGFASYLFVENKLFPSFRISVTLQNTITPFLIFLISLPLLVYVQSLSTGTRSHTIFLRGENHTHVVCLEAATNPVSLPDSVESPNFRIPEQISALVKLPSTRTKLLTNTTACHSYLASSPSKSTIVHLAQGGTHQSATETLKAAHSISRHVSVDRVITTNLAIDSQHLVDPSIANELQMLRTLPVDLAVQNNGSLAILEQLGFDRSVIIGSFAYFTKHSNEANPISCRLQQRVGKWLQQRQPELPKKALVSFSDLDLFGGSRVAQPMLKNLSLLLLTNNDEQASLLTSMITSSDRIYTHLNMSQIEHLIVSQRVDVVVADRADVIAVAALAGVPGLLVLGDKRQQRKESDVLKSMKIPAFSFSKTDHVMMADVVSFWNALPTTWLDDLERTRCSLAQNVQGLYRYVDVQLAVAVSESCIFERRHQIYSQDCTLQKAVPPEPKQPKNDFPKT